MPNAVAIVAGSVTADVRATLRAHLDDMPRPAVELRKVSENLFSYLNSLPRPLVESEDHTLQTAVLAAIAGIASASYHAASGRFFGMKRSVGVAMLGSYGATFLAAAYELMLRNVNQRLYSCPASDYYATAHR